MTVRLLPPENVEGLDGADFAYPHIAPHSGDQHDHGEGQPQVPEGDHPRVVGQPRSDDRDHQGHQTDAQAIAGQRGKARHEQDHVDQLAPLTRSPTPFTAVVLLSPSPNHFVRSVATIAWFVIISLIGVSKGDRTASRCRPRSRRIQRTLADEVLAG